MRILAAIALIFWIQGCGPSSLHETSLSEGQETQAACFAQEDTRLCLPHIGRGERIFALVGRDDAAAMQRLSAHLIEAMGESRASAAKLNDGFTKAEDEARRLHPEFDLYDVSAFFPVAVRNNLNRLKNFSGPNCFATALMASGLLEEDELLYVGLDELQLYFDHYFAKVSEPRFGDIIHYDVQGSKDHAAFYVLDGLVFHKKGYRKGYGYRMTELTKVFVADPFEWRPSPFDSHQPKDDASFGEKPKRYYRRLAPDAVAPSPTPSPKEAAAVAVVNHIDAQMKHSAPHWSVHKDMGTMMESAIRGLVDELAFLKNSAAFDAKLAYERLRSLESQAFQSIDDSLYTSPRADEAEINEKYCIPDNEFLSGLLTKYYVYRHGAQPDANALGKMMADVNSIERKTCRFKWGEDW